MSGVVFPISDKKTGARKTTLTNQKIFAAAAEVVDKQLAADILAEKNWRFKYSNYVGRYVKGCLKSPQVALDSARAGLAEAHSRFEFIREGDETQSVDDTVRAINDNAQTFFTGSYTGKAKSDGVVTVTYGGEVLRGAKLKQLAARWVKQGTIEPTAAQAIYDVVDNRDWGKLGDLTFVLLGAGAAMGPFNTLMELGANVVAVDINREGVWKRLLAKAESCSGTFTFPMDCEQTDGMSQQEIAKHAGADIIARAPEIASWVASLFPNTRLILGNYVYLKGDLFPRVTIACDIILRYVLEKRADAALSMLGTPTDCYVIPQSAYRQSVQAYRAKGLSELPLVLLRNVVAPFTRNQLRPNVTRSDQVNDFAVCNQVLIEQGPNYILSKRIQQWRIMVARAEGHTVSFNVAPSTRTVSVTQNRLFAWGYNGMEWAFPQIEIFAPATSNTVMTALLINDLRNSESPANPKVPLDNPLQLFSSNAVHGGFWRMPYSLSSIGVISVVLHFVKQFRLLLIFLNILICYYLYTKVF